MSVDPPEAAAVRVLELLAADTGAGWRLFVTEYTPTLLTLIAASGVREHDEAMDVYVRVCEQLVANECERLRRFDPARGRMGGWLTAVVRNAVVDWIRSRRGRRRLFGSIKALDPIDQQVFDLFYYRGHRVTEIAGVLRMSQPTISVADVFESLDRIEHALSSRQRAELMTMAAGVRDPISLEPADGETRHEPADPAGGPELTLVTAEMTRLLEAALARLPVEEALIVSMHYLEGLTKPQIERALGVGPITNHRMTVILARLRVLLEDSTQKQGT